MQFQQFPSSYLHLYKKDWKIGALLRLKYCWEMSDGTVVVSREEKVVLEENRRPFSVLLLMNSE